MPASGQPDPAIHTADPVAPAFAYRNGFWRNLHHTLYAFASTDPSADPGDRIELRAEDIAVRDRLAAGDAAIWAEAVGWYVRNFSRRDLRADDELAAVGEALSVAGDTARLDAAAIPEELRAILGRAAPVYRAHFWSSHRQANEAWRAAVAPLVAAHGATVARRLSEILGSPWPGEPIEVALTPYAKSLGAYTTIGPTRITIATAHGRYQGSAAFEMLMHEAGHGMAWPLQQRLATLIAEQTARPGANLAYVRDGLWHQILFHATGRIVADAVPGHVPYADRNGLWRRAWPGPVREALATHIDAYLAGTTGRDEALQGLVRDLVAAPPPT